MKLPLHTVQAPYPSPLGPMTLAATDVALVGAWFTDQAHLPDLSPYPSAPGHPMLRLAADQLDEYFAKQRQHFDLPLHLGTGTLFQNAVWQALCAIGHGQTCTYGMVSQQVGRPRRCAPRSGRGAQPVKHHRAVSSGDGCQRLTGYAGGLWRKTALLKLEGRRL